MFTLLTKICSVIWILNYITCNKYRIYVIIFLIINARAVIKIIKNSICSKKNGQFNELCVNHAHEAYCPHNCCFSQCFSVRLMIVWRRIKIAWYRQRHRIFWPGLQKSVISSAGRLAKMKSRTCRPFKSGFSGGLINDWTRITVDCEKISTILVNRLVAAKIVINLLQIQKYFYWAVYFLITYFYN